MKNASYFCDDGVQTFKSIRDIDAIFWHATHMPIYNTLKDKEKESFIERVVVH